MKLKEFINASIQINNINDKKEVILIIPGGGYSHVSEREATPVANKFNSLGFNTCILYYSVYPNNKDIILSEAYATISYLEKDYDKIHVLGFSAGAHLAGILATSNIKSIKSLIMCYPVVSFVSYPHLGSLECFLGANSSIDERIKYSIERRVNEFTPPTFIWTTKDDNTVDYHNSIILKEALDKYNIKNEFVLFDSGIHGLALADETTMENNDQRYINDKISKWPILVREFINNIG